MPIMDTELQLGLLLCRKWYVCLVFWSCSGAMVWLILWERTYSALALAHFMGEGSFYGREFRLYFEQAELKKRDCFPRFKLDGLAWRFSQAFSLAKPLAEPSQAKARGPALG